MSRVVFKYRLREDHLSVDDFGDAFHEIRAPRGAVVVLVGDQPRDHIAIATLWLLVDDEEPHVSHRIFIVPTGGPVPGGTAHIGSTTTAGGFVWHLFAALVPALTPLRAEVDRLLAEFDDPTTRREITLPYIESRLRGAR